MKGIKATVEGSGSHHIPLLVLLLNTNLCCDKPLNLLKTLKGMYESKLAFNLGEKYNVYQALSAAPCLLFVVKGPVQCKL